MTDPLHALCDELLALTLTATPFSATLLGIPGYDRLVPDVSEEAEASQAAAAQSIAQRAEAIDPEALGDVDRVTRAIVIHEASSMVENAELRRIEFETAPMFVAPHSQVLQVVPRTILADAERADAYLERLSKIPAFLDTAGGRLRAGTAKGLTAAKRSLDASIAALDSYLASDLQTDLLHEPTPAVPDADFEEKRTALVRDEVRPALARMRDTYVELLADARDDDKVGVGWLPDGDHIYEVCARTNTTTKLTPHELHQLGLDVLEQLRAEYSDIGGRVFGTTDPDAVFERMRSDASYKLTGVDELKEISQAALDRCEAALPDWFGRLPSSRCAMEVIPDEEAKTSAPAYYRPPDKTTGRVGTYWINGHAITERVKFDVECIAFHEAIPGHHMQLAIAQELDELPLYRRVMISSAYAEGWGLYTERLADEMGLYSSDVQRLGMLQCDSWRACRLVVDTGMHALGWSFSRAVEFMLTNTAVNPTTVNAECGRYVGMPGQALSYMVGRLEIQRMRREAEAALGADFDIKGFHDTVLGTGSVPLSVLDGEVRRWAASLSD